MKNNIIKELSLTGKYTRKLCYCDSDGVEVHSFENDTEYFEITVRPRKAMKPKEKNGK